MHLYVVKLVKTRNAAISWESTPAAGRAIEPALGGVASNGPVSREDGHPMTESAARVGPVIPADPSGIPTPD